MKIIKRTLVITGILTLSMNVFNVSAQQTETVSFQPNYNTRNLYMRVSYGIGGGDWATRGMGIGLFAKVRPGLYGGFSGYYFGDAGGRAAIQQIIPVSGEIQYELETTEKGNGAILVGTSVGYNFVLNREYYNNRYSTPGLIQNGLYFNPSIGYRLNFTRNTGVIFDLGYQLVQGKGIDMDSEAFLQNHVQHNILLKGSLFF